MVLVFGDIRIGMTGVQCGCQSGSRNNGVGGR